MRTRAAARVLSPASLGTGLNHARPRSSYLEILVYDRNLHLDWGGVIFFAQLRTPPSGRCSPLSLCRHFRARHPCPRPSLGLRLSVPCLCQGAGRRPGRVFRTRLGSLCEIESLPAGGKRPDINGEHLGSPAVMKLKVVLLGSRY